MRYWTKISPINSAALLAAGLAFLVYLRTLAPTVFALDSAELTLGAYSLGLVHAPGYAVYMLVGHLFTRFPLVDPGYSLNVLSALSSAATVAVLGLLVNRLLQSSTLANNGNPVDRLRDLTGPVLPGFVAGLSYAFCYYVWSLSVIAEVYTLQVLFLACILLALVQWRSTGRHRWLFTATVITGLAAANNPATALWWPGLFLLVWTSHYLRHLTVRDYRWLIVFFLIALTPLLYLPVRSVAQPALVQVGRYDAAGAFHPLDLTRPANLLWYLSGRQFGDWILGYSPVEYSEQAVRFLHWLWAAFLGVGLPLGLVGVWSTWKRNRGLATALLLTVLPHAVFFIGYRAADKETMFLPVYFVWAILLGVAVEQVLIHLPRQARMLVILLPAALLWVNFSYADVSNFRIPYDRAGDRLQEAEAGALYLATWGDAELMRYHQLMEGLRPDVHVVNLFFISSADLTTLVYYQHQLERSVYSTYEVSALARRFDVWKSGGAGYRVLPRRGTP